RYGAPPPLHPFPTRRSSDLSHTLSAIDSPTWAARTCCGKCATLMASGRRSSTAGSATGRPVSGSTAWGVAVPVGGSGVDVAVAEGTAVSVAAAAGAVVALGTAMVLVAAGVVVVAGRVGSGVAVSTGVLAQ